MIKIKVSEMLGKHKMTRKELSKLTGIRPNTVGMLYDETIKRIEVEWIDKLCEVFECEVTDIIEYFPNKRTTDKALEQGYIVIDETTRKPEYFED
jgi:putative transcriptional regulator